MANITTFFNAASIGLQQGIVAARRVFEDPSSADTAAAFRSRNLQYSLLWSYYNNSMFERLPHVFNNYGTWNAGNLFAAYKANYNLYRGIRMIYNPTARLVDFYVGSVYPGVLSLDGDAMPDGMSIAIPFTKDTPDEVKEACAQLWQWSNWQANKSVQVRYGAALGNVLTEVIDDVEAGKVSLDVPWPGHVSHLKLDRRGNVLAYTLEYQTHDDEDSSQQYTYKKVIDAESFKYFRNGEPYDYGQGSEVENPYGFCPAVWTKHIDVGGPNGVPAIAGTLGKIDELNNLVSHTHDQIHKVIEAPNVLWSNGSIAALFSRQKREPTIEEDPQAQNQESINLLKGPQGGSVSSLAGNLDLGQALAWMQENLSEIEKDHPELTVYEQLRAMSQVTGPAASRLVGDVTPRIIDAQAMYDQQNIKLFQMALAIAGMRANSGAWGSLDRQQQKFTMFNMDSYKRGDLDMEINVRPLLVPTKQEIAQDKQSMWTGVKMATDAGVPLSFALKDAGFTEEDVATINDHQANEQRARLADTIPMEQ